MIRYGKCNICNTEQVMVIKIPGRGTFEFAHCADCEELLDVLEECLSIARSIGVPKYGPSSWRNVSIQEHLEHASKHVYAARKLPGILVKYDSEDHLAHAICRLVMVRALQDAN